MEKSYTEIVKKIDELNIFGKNKTPKKKQTAEQIIFGVIARGGLKLSHKKGG